jgi:hypothetical protein
MDVTPTPSTPKRSRTKVAGNAPTVTIKAAKKPAAAKARTPKAVESEIDVLKIPSRVAPSSEQLIAMISVAAYYRAAARGFAPGGEMNDWLEAERQIIAAVS